MSGPVLFLCQTCEGAEPGLAGRLRAAAPGLRVRPGACMSGCAQGPTLAVRQSGKMAYLFGPFGAADIADLQVFLRLYAAAPDGDLADARPIGGLRHKALARIPAVSD